jgi:hypothetical protein
MWCELFLTTSFAVKIFSSRSLPETFWNLKLCNKFPFSATFKLRAIKRRHAFATIDQRREPWTNHVSSIQSPVAAALRTDHTHLLSANAGPSSETAHHVTIKVESRACTRCLACSGEPASQENDIRELYSAEFVGALLLFRLKHQVVTVCLEIGKEKAKLDK